MKERKEILLITWHGIHELELFPGLPDTGGQNIYVQCMAETLHDLSPSRVIILNRGGFPHPYTQRMREGYSKDPNRELYVLHVPDGVDSFLRKEFLTGALIEQASERVLEMLPVGYTPDMIISHFWDGGLMGSYLRKSFPQALHIWVPHEPVGMKKSPLPPEHHERHSIFARERYEKAVMHECDLVGSTSKLVEQDLIEYYEGQYNRKLIDMYPGVDTARFSPREPRMLSGAEARCYGKFLHLPPEIFLRPHICEFGRSDSLKRKDEAVAAFAIVAKHYKDIDLFLNLDEKMEPATGERIRQIIQANDLQDRVHILSPQQLPQNGEGSEIMPDLLKTAKVFLTMSSMEGFGMAACEAAACGIPVVGTDRIPVVTDIIAPKGGGKVVPAHDIEAAAAEVLSLLKLEDSAWQATSLSAHRSVIPAFTWKSIVETMNEQIGLKRPLPGKLSDRRDGVGVQDFI